MRVFGYFLRELIPQFLSALIVICAVIVVSQLVRMSEVLVAFGLTLENVFLPFLYLILPFLSLAIPIAYLFAVLITFGRMSADNEYTALLAAGYSLKRAAVPVMLVAAVLYGVAATCALHLEAWGRRELVQFLYRKTQTELDNMVQHKMQPGVFLDDFLGYVIYAEKISQDRQRFENVLLAPGSKNRNDNFVLMAPEGRITGRVETGDLRLSLNYGMAFAARQDTDRSSILKFKRAEIDMLRVFEEQILGADSADDDFRSYPPGELAAYIDRLEKDPKEDRSLYRRARYLLHQRVANPFAIVSFAMFGMVLGIADPRRGKSLAWVGAIGAIIGSYIVIMSLKSLAEKGTLSAPVAAWLPNLLLISFASFLVYQKHRLPPSEGALDPSNIGLIQRFRRKRS